MLECVGRTDRRSNSLGDRSSFPSGRDLEFLFSSPVRTLALLPLTLSLMWVSPVLAQLIPDGTLGAESSVVTPIDALGDRIDGGAIRGSNLFHSFQDFNIDDDRGAFFSNPIGIENILTRVTGSNPSNIFGTLGVLGDANLFLVNPNGIVFGPNARLDVGGSFFASTAEGITFLDGYQFSATNPDVPPLLTINVPIGLQFGATPGEIVNQSTTTPIINGEESLVSLQVPPGETLALVGGNLLFDGGGIISPGSRVELAGLAAPGTVGLNPDGSLSVPPDVSRADVSIVNESGVIVAAENGGSITIHARNFELSGGGGLFAGIAPDMGSPDSQAGEINIHATGDVNLRQSRISNSAGFGSLGDAGDLNIQTGSMSVTEDAELISSMSGQGNAGSINVTATDTVSFDDSGAFSIVNEEAVGNAGDINIQTGSLSLTEGAQLISSTFGQGNAGSITVIATDAVSFDDSEAFSIVEPGAVGNVGDVNIQTGSLLVTEGTRISASTRGQGNAGSVNVTATDTVSFDGLSRAFSGVEPGAMGDGGNINIQTGSLSLTEGAQISASTFGQGNAGSVNVTATDTVSFNDSGAFSTVGAEAVGNGGEIHIQTGSLSVTEGAQISASTRGQGNAGSVNVTATDTVSFDGERNDSSSGITSNVNSGAVGDGGDINIQTGSLFLTEGAQISASIFEQGKGNAGSINIQTGSMSVTEGARISASTRGQGNAGSVNITATEMVSLDGERNGSLSGIGSIVNAGGVGNGGDINIQTGSLFLTEGAQISASTFGRGNAGSVNVTATDTVSFEGERNRASSGIVTIVDEGVVGNGGNIKIQTGSMSVTEGAQISASTSGQGNAGSVNVIATDTVSFDGGRNGFLSGIFSTVEAGAVGNSGEIQISGREISVTNGAQLQTLVSEAENNLPGGRGNAGDVNLIAAETVSFEGEGNGLPSVVVSAVEAGAVGNAGNINIQTGSLFVTEGAGISTRMGGQGNAGNVNVTATDTVSFNDSVAFSDLEPGAVGNGGNINIQTGSLFVTEGAQISARTGGQGNAGSINVTANDTVSFDGERDGSSSGAFSRVEEGAVGNGGNINIQTGSLFVTSDAQISASLRGQGNAGSVNMTATDTVSFDFSGAFSSVEEGAMGDGGDINIQTGSLSVTQGAQLVASTSGQGNAGSVNVMATDTVSFDGERNERSSGAYSRVNAEAVGDAGDVNIQTGSLSVTEDARISASTFGRGHAGRVNVRATETVSFKDSGAFSTVEEGAMGNGGGINIQTGSLSVTEDALIAAGTLGQGNAGSINVTATDTVSFDFSGAYSTVEEGAVGDGGDINIQTRSLSLTEEALISARTRGQGNAGNVNLRATEAVSFDGFSGAFSRVEPGVVGDGGDIRIRTGSLSLTDYSQLTASNRGVGASGSLDVEADSIRLDRSSLSADIADGNEGNITVRSSTLFLRNQSSITTDARGRSMGGNITLNSDVIAALENSDISANAQEASGGRVTIDTQGLFGTAFRERLTPQSDITATSALGPDFSGTVEITPPEVDPASGLVSLPESPVDAASLFGKDFCSQRGTSQFVFTGRGGIPPSPFDPLGGSSPIEIDWVEAPDSPEVEEPESRQETPSPVVRPLIEAQGWVVAADGTIVLTAQPYQGTPAPPALSYPDCQHLNLNAQ